MKKITCPQCGTINLEKFVTFPHCAGCGARLSVAREPSRASIWRRPLRVGFWASLVGLAMAGAVMLSFSATEKGEPQQLLVYARIPRQVRVGEVMSCYLSLDSVGEREGTALRSVTWRLARSSERSWDVVEVTPPPDTQQSRLSREAWVYQSWLPEQRWTLRLRARAKGQKPLAIIASASDHLPVTRRATVTVR